MIIFKMRTMKFMTIIIFRMKTMKYMTMIIFRIKPNTFFCCSAKGYLISGGKIIFKMGERFFLEGN